MTKLYRVTTICEGWLDNRQEVFIIIQSGTYVMCLPGLDLPSSALVTPCLTRVITASGIIVYVSAEHFAEAK